MIFAAAALAAQVALAPCPIEGVPGQAQCGTYKVWENRDARQGRQIDLSIIVLSALEPNKQADPFFMLPGRPWRRAVVQRALLSAAPFTTSARRATSCSSICAAPVKSAALTCPELARPDADGNFDPDLLSVPAVRACRARLEKIADLRLYTTEIAVDDLEEVRQALGYGPINVYGTSYGTRVAQVYMRKLSEEPSRRGDERDRAPVDGDARDARARRRGRVAGPGRALPGRCELPPHIPDARRRLPPVARAARKDAPVLTQPASADRPAATIQVTRGLFAEAFRNVLYTPEGSAQAPQAGAAIAGRRRSRPRGNRARRTHGAGRRSPRGWVLPVGHLHRGHSVSVEGCRRAWPPERSAATIGCNSSGRRARSGRAAPCRARIGSRRQSAMPTLLISGEFDPVTPPSGGDEVRAALVDGPSRRDPQQRSSDRQRRSVHRPDDRRSFSIAASVDGLAIARCAADNPAPPFLLSGKTP